MVFSPPLNACSWDDDDGSRNSGSGSLHEGEGEDDDDCQGGNIDGCETLIARVFLVATESAPVGSRGCAKLKAENEDGVVNSELSLVLFGLEPGTYPLSIVKKSDGSSVVLAQIEIGGGCDEDDDGDEDDGEHHHGDDSKSGHSARDGVLVSEHDLHLPPEVDPMDIAQIIVSDADGNALLVGDFLDPAAGSLVRFKARLRVRTGAASAQTTVSQKRPDKALALSTARKGRRADRFTMIASGLAANSTFTLQVNGQSAGIVKSNRKGMALIRKLPESLMTVRSVRLVDETGQNVARTNF